MEPCLCFSLSNITSWNYFKCLMLRKNLMIDLNFLMLQNTSLWSHWWLCGLIGLPTTYYMVISLYQCTIVALLPVHIDYSIDFYNQKNFFLDLCNVYLNHDACLKFSQILDHFSLPMQPSFLLFVEDAWRFIMILNMGKWMEFKLILLPESLERCMNFQSICLKFLG